MKYNLEYSTMTEKEYQLKPKQKNKHKTVTVLCKNKGNAVI